MIYRTGLSPGNLPCYEHSGVQMQATEGAGRGVRRFAGGAPCRTNDSRATVKTSETRVEFRINAVLNVGGTLPMGSATLLITLIWLTLKNKITLQW